MVDLILPRDLPAAVVAASGGALPIDNGSVVQKVTPKQIVDSGRPFASQAQAEAGTSAVVAMSPLTTRQAIEAVVPAVVTPYVNLAEAWAESATPPDPGIPTSRSAKTWADQAKLSADAAEAAAENFEFATLSEAQEGVNDTHSMNPQRVRQYIEGGVFKPSYGTAVTTTILTPLEQFVQPEWFGAKKDGVTDDGPAIQAAINTGRDVYFGVGVYLSNQTLTLTRTGQSLIGCGGITNAGHGTEIRFSNLSGPATHIMGRTISVKRIHVGATAGRMNSGDVTGRGIFIAGPDDNPATHLYNSRINIEEVLITNQPSDGFYALGTLELSRFVQITVADCLGHGFVHDAGQTAGYTYLKMAPFWCDYISCRSFENAGNAFVFGADISFGVQGINLHRPEALSCCWDPAKRISDHMMLLTGTNITVFQPDVEDQQYANTTTETTGIPRIARTVPTNGIRPAGTNHRYIQPFFSSLNQSIVSEGIPRGIEVDGPRIFPGNYGVPQNPAFAFASGSFGVVVRAQTSSATGAAVLLQNQSANAQIFIDGIEYKGLVTTLADWRIVTTSPPTATISGGAVSVTSDKVLLAGEGGVADSLANIRIGVGVNGYVGLETVLMYAGQDITIATTGNIGILGGGALTLSATRPIIRAVYDGTKWWVQ